MVIKGLKIAAIVAITVVILAWFGTLDEENGFALNTGEGASSSADTADKTKEEKVFLLCIEGATDASEDCAVSKEETAIKKPVYYVCSQAKNIDLNEDCEKITEGDKPEETPEADETAEPTEESEDDPTATSESIGGGNQLDDEVDCPETNAEWLGMVTSKLGSNGTLMTNTVHNDDYDYIRVKIKKSWRLPDDWSSNVEERTLKPGVYSIYPPFVCQGTLEPSEEG